MPGSWKRNKAISGKWLLHHRWANVFDFAIFTCTSFAKRCVLYYTAGLVSAARLRHVRQHDYNSDERAFHNFGQDITQKNGASETS